MAIRWPGLLRKSGSCACPPAAAGPARTLKARSVVEFFDGAPVWCSGEQLWDAGLPAGMAKIRSDFRKRDEHEFSLEHAWVGNLQFGRVNRFVAVEQNVQIDFPRPLCEGFFAAHAGFDDAKRAQQIQS